MPGSIYLDARSSAVLPDETREEADADRPGPGDEIFLDRTGPSNVLGHRYLIFTINPSLFPLNVASKAFFFGKLSDDVVPVR